MSPFKLSHLLVYKSFQLYLSVFFDHICMEKARYKFLNYYYYFLLLNEGNNIL